MGRRPDLDCSLERSAQHRDFPETRQAVEAALARLSADGIDSQRLEVSHAFHSARMEPMLDEFEQIAGSISYQRPQLAWASNVTGRMVAAEEVSQRGILAAPGSRAGTLCPGNSVPAGTGLQNIRGSGSAPGTDRHGEAMYRRRGGHLGSHPAAQPKEWDQLLSALAALYVHGVRIDWLAFDRDYHRRRLGSAYLSLPSVNDSGLKVQVRPARRNANRQPLAIRQDILCSGRPSLRPA